MKTPVKILSILALLGVASFAAYKLIKGRKNNANNSVDDTADNSLKLPTPPVITPTITATSTPVTTTTTYSDPDPDPDPEPEPEPTKYLSLYPQYKVLNYHRSGKKSDLSFVRIPENELEFVGVDPWKYNFKTLFNAIDYSEKWWNRVGANIKVYHRIGHSGDSSLYFDFVPGSKPTTSTTTSTTTTTAKSSTTTPVKTKKVATLNSYVGNKVLSSVKVVYKDMPENDLMLLTEGNPINFDWTRFGVGTPPPQSVWNYYVQIYGLKSNPYGNDNFFVVETTTKIPESEKPKVQVATVDNSTAATYYYIKNMDVVEKFHKYAAMNPTIKVATYSSYIGNALANTPIVYEQIKPSLLEEITTNPNDMNWSKYNLETPPFKAFQKPVIIMHIKGQPYNKGTFYIVELS